MLVLLLLRKNIRKTQKINQNKKNQISSMCVFVCVCVYTRRNFSVCLSVSISVILVTKIIKPIKFRFKINLLMGNPLLYQRVVGFSETVKLNNSMSNARTIHSPKSSPPSILLYASIFIILLLSAMFSQSFYAI